MSENLFIFSNGALIPEYKIDANLLEIKDVINKQFRDRDKICINSEACLEVVYSQMEEGQTKAAIDLLKNKFAFRTATATFFPELHFYKTSLADLKTIEKKSVIKPIKGFFSAGVRVLEATDDLESIKQEISGEMSRLTKYFSEAVLSSEEWLVEEFIEGEEIAIDMYFAADGTPVILNITHHPMPTDTHYLNTIYWTSEKLFNTWKLPLERFFNFLNSEVLKVTNFPIHAEFRIKNGQLIPIELNPLRFGGFGLADLAYYGLGFNPYEMFFKGEVPDWDIIWKKHKGQRYCWVLGYNGKAINPELHTPNHDHFIDFCGLDSLLHYRPIDYKKQPVFALAYLSASTQEKIDSFLCVDFNQFFSLIKRNSPII
jgi:hypothetical protein